MKFHFRLNNLFLSPQCIPKNSRINVKLNLLNDIKEFIHHIAVCLHASLSLLSMKRGQLVSEFTCILLLFQTLKKNFVIFFLLLFIYSWPFQHGSIIQVLLGIKNAVFVELPQMFPVVLRGSYKAPKTAKQILHEALLHIVSV